MPTTRRRSILPSTPTLGTALTRDSSAPMPPSSDSAKAGSTSKRGAMGRTATPSQHHKSADELALEEAAKLIYTPNAAMARDEDEDEGQEGLLSPRAARYRNLTRTREKVLEAPFRSGSVVEEDGDETITTGGLVEDIIGSEVDGEELEEMQGEASHPGTEGRDASDSRDSSSDEEDDSDPDSETSEEDDNENDSDEEEERLEKLLAAARVSAAKSASAAKERRKGVEEGERGGEDVLQLDAEDTEAPIPGLAIPKLPAPHLSFSNDGSAQASANQPATAGPSRPRSAGKNGVKRSEEGLEVDDRPYERELTKREKAARPRKATVSELWTKLPAPKTELLGQMKKDYQALALSNSLDPKRFMKGGKKLTKVPEIFGIGTLIDAPKHLQDTTLTREHRYRPGQIVSDITADQSTGEFAKRKYGDLQWSRMENGRGKGWKKRSKW